MTTGVPETVYVIDDDASVRDSLVIFLSLKGFQVRAFSSAKAFLDAMPPVIAGCLLLDIRMPRITGLQLQAELAARGIEVPVVIITGHGDVSAARSAFLHGAVDFLEKPLEEKSVLRAIGEALNRDRQRREQEASSVQLDTSIARLTAREREVMELMCDGHRNLDIAEQLGISPRTVEVHKAHLMAKLQVDSLAELIRLRKQLHL
jgi:RNA polymerase sigma factor (sigma-70 family)